MPDIKKIDVNFNNQEKYDNIKYYNPKQNPCVWFKLV